MLCLGCSRGVFPVEEIGPRDAEDVVQGSFQNLRHPATFRVSYTYLLHTFPTLRFGW